MLRFHEYCFNDSPDRLSAERRTAEYSLHNTTDRPGRRLFEKGKEKERYKLSDIIHVMETYVHELSHAKMFVLVFFVKFMLPGIYHSQ